MAEPFDYARPTTSDLRATPPVAISRRICRGFTAIASINADGLRIAAERVSSANFVGGVAVVTVPIVLALLFVWRASSGRANAWFTTAAVAFALVMAAFVIGSFRLHRASRSQTAWLLYRRPDRQIELPSARLQYDLRNIAGLEYVETSVEDDVDGELRLLLAADDSRVAVVRDDAVTMRKLLPTVAGELGLPLVEFIVGERPWNGGGIWITSAGGMRTQMTDNTST